RMGFSVLTGSFAPKARPSSGDDRIVVLRQPLSHELWLLRQLTLIHINAALRQDRAFGRPENDDAIPQRFGSLFQFIMQKSNMPTAPFSEYDVSRTGELGDFSKALRACWPFQVG